MKTELFDFKENVDEWIRHINSDMEAMKDLPVIIEEHDDNIEHNYELIHLLKDNLNALQSRIRQLEEFVIIQGKVIKSLIPKENGEPKSQILNKR